MKGIISANIVASAKIIERGPLGFSNSKNVMTLISNSKLKIPVNIMNPCGIYYEIFNGIFDRD